MSKSSGMGSKKSQSYTDKGINKNASGHGKYHGSGIALKDKHVEDLEKNYNLKNIPAQNLTSPQKESKENHTKATKHWASKKIINLKGNIDYLENSIVSKIIVSDNGSSLTLFSFDEGQAIDKHMTLAHTVIQALEGEVHITISNEEFNLKEGEIVLMPKGEPHSLKAKTKFKIALFKV